MRLGDLVGQTRAVTVLRNAIRRERVAHAYLFCGPEGVGKSTAALAFARALNCQAQSHGRAQPEGWPPPARPDKLGADGCGVCQSCRLIARGNHPDVRLITIGGGEGPGRTEISIDQIRQNPKKLHETPRPLVQDAYLKPVLGHYKVYIIDPADRMSGEGGNALLHVLEDPPSHVVLVLVTANASVLLPTVVSRCQQVAFELVGASLIEAQLLVLGVELATAAALARLSGGRIAWAMRAAQRPQILAAREALLELCADLERQSIPASLRVAEEVKLLAAELVSSREGAESDSGGPEGEEESVGAAERVVADRALRAELPWCLDVMLSWYRDSLAACEGGGIANANRAEAGHGALVSGHNPRAEAGIEAILATRHRIQRNANIDLALEGLAVALIGGGE